MYLFSEKDRIGSVARNVDKLSHDECWEWKGYKDHQGYGYLWNGKRNMRAHRYVWQLFFGPIPEGKMILHKCNNPSCVNPYHLYPGSGSDNMTDRTNSGYIHAERIPKTLYEFYKSQGE